MMISSKPAARGSVRKLPTHHSKHTTAKSAIPISRQLCRYDDSRRCKRQRRAHHGGVQATLLLTFTVALAIAVALPGPGIFSVVSCAIGHGFRHALALTAGIVLGDLIYFCLAVLGLAALARSLGDLFLFVKLAGALYLIWLGVKLWRSRPATPTDVVANVATPERGYTRDFVAGFLVTISNPKTIGFYAGLLPTFIDLERLRFSDAAAMTVIVVVVVGLIPAAYAYAAARSRRFFQSPRSLQALNRTAGTMMIGSGIAVATQ
ncbi:MAG: LysE family translocator [Opitutus sp.]|nr:LysE family translocator [Opitutus sp.]